MNGGGHGGGCGPDGPRPLKGRGGGRFPDGVRVVCETCGESAPLNRPNQFIGFAMNHTFTHPDHKGFHAELKRC